MGFLQTCGDVKLEGSAGGPSQERPFLVPGPPPPRHHHHDHQHLGRLKQCGRGHTPGNHALGACPAAGPSHSRVQGPSRRTRQFCACAADETPVQEVPTPGLSARRASVRRGGGPRLAVSPPGAWRQRTGRRRCHASDRNLGPSAPVLTARGVQASSCLEERPG